MIWIVISAPVHLMGRPFAIPHWVGIRLFERRPVCSSQCSNRLLSSGLWTSKTAEIVLGLLPILRVMTRVRRR